MKASEDEKLLENIQTQQRKLLRQMEDLEDLKQEADLDADELAELRGETEAQLKDFAKFLSRLEQGNMSLLPAIAHAKLALQKAVAKSFAAADIRGFFAAQQPITLRTRLSELLAKGKGLADEANAKEAIEVLSQLKAIDKLKTDEADLLSELQSKVHAGEFQAKSSAKGKSELLAQASSQISKHA